MRFTLARRLGKPNIDTEEKDDEKMADEHNLFNMLPPEEKIIDINEDIKNTNDVSESKNQNNNENVQDERIDKNMGKVKEFNTNKEINKGNEHLDDESLKERLRMMNKGIANLNNGNDESKDNGNVNDYNEGEKGEYQELKSELKDMEDFSSLSNKSEELKDKELILKNCYPIYRNGIIHKWMTTLNSKQISNLYQTNQIFYDFDVQRGFRTTKKGELKPMIVTSHYNAILKKMMSSEIAGGALTLCYYKEYGDNLEYNETEHTIKIKHKLAIIDGAHRVFSCIKMVKLNKKDTTNPDPEKFEYPIFLEQLSKQQAMALFSEYANAGKKIGKVRTEALNVFDDAHNIAEEIIKSSELHNKVERVASSPKENNIMLFSTLMNGIRLFKIQTKRDSEQIIKFLSEFWSELIYLYKDKMGNMDYKTRKEIRKQTFLLEPMFLTGMFHVAKTLYEKYPNDWIDKLKKLKEDEEFFSRNNKIWLPIQRENGATINISATQKIVIDLMLKQVTE